MSQSIKNNPEFSSINPQKLELIDDFVQQNQGKKVQELIPQFIALKSKMVQKGLSFTPAESDLMLNVLKQSMTPEEQKRVEQMQNMVHGKKNGF
ncbi:MAG: hypothetical protein IJA32_02145 [Lachnospiraceae bacterium]|nr:hypothetical protein [Lachnospiraceae bacterium]